MNTLNRLLSLKLLLILIIGSASPAFGQTNCSQVLVDAQNLYEDGKINEIPEFMEPCLRSGFTKEEKIEAYKLLSMVYTFLDEDANADQAVLNLLKLDKEYEINPELDPAEFIEVFNTFRTYPVLRIGPKLGTNTNFFHFYETRQVFNSPENGGTYKSLNGFHGGLSVEVPIKDMFEVVPEVYFFSRSYNSSNVDEVLGEPFYTEKQSWIMVPLYFRYKHLKWQIIPYADLGFIFGYLLTAELTNLETLNQAGPNETPTQDIIESREQFNYFISGGLGAKYKIPMGYLFVEARYGYQINKMNSWNSTDVENRIHYNNAIIENIFSMDFITLQLGYMFNIYSPKKLEK